MGKIKNRDQKRKSAHIYCSGGGGGGGKGPPQPDKREQELPCPHCDRVFKQSGRLKDHIQKHHPEAESEDTEASESSASSNAGTSGESGVVMQDVNSKTGYYTHKSPKLLLFEWCKRQNRRKPIYRIRQLKDQKVGCKVVLPDMKYANKDIVVFLDESQAADDNAEAEQRGATAALHHVAGSSSYDQVLPPQYSHLWTVHVERAKQREEQQALWQQREKAKAQKQKRQLSREKEVVVMSEENVRLVEAVVRELRSQGGTAREKPAPVAQSRGNSAEAVRKLLKMGFSKKNVDEVVHVLGKGASLNEMLDWLCIHLPHEVLPESLVGSSKTNKVEILRAGQAPQRDLDLSHPFVDSLSQFGYEGCDAAEALIATDYHYDQAHKQLYSKLTGLEVCAQPYKSQAEEDSAWNEESMALEAIYGEDVEFPNPSSAIIKVSVPREEIANLHVEDETVHLYLHILGVGPDYPDVPPLISLHSEHIPPHVLRSVTRHLASCTKDLQGMPMVHELLTACTDYLSSLPLDVAKGYSDGANVAGEPADEGTSASDWDESASVSTSSSRQTLGSSKNKKGGHRPKYKPSSEEIEAENKLLKSQQDEILTSSKHAKMQKVRQALPASKERVTLTDTIAKSRVVIITGMPGCGKSTQVPQFLLEQAIAEGQGASCNIVCTQPRRISALGLASRVADERGEDVGDVVGYAIRNQSSRSKRTRVMFCTTGVLLRQMISDHRLSGVTHVLVDEVHERSVEMDLLLLLLKENLRRPKCHKVVLMSATANAGEFAKYFENLVQVGPVPIVHIPGFTHPVREFYLEDAIDSTGFELKKVPAGKPKSQGPSRKSGSSSAAPNDDEEDDDDPTSLLHPSKKQSKKIQALMDQMQVGYELIEAVVAFIIEKEKMEGPSCLLNGWSEYEKQGNSGSAMRNGAILIFLPGALEINKMVKLLQDSQQIRQSCGGNSIRVFPLHASLPAAQQKRVFDTMPNGVRKIVVSTNVAETSVTIPDVTVVIDTCFVKEVGYDAERRISRLQLGWVSQASAKQRAGRAGRVRCGVCFRLVTRKQWKGLRVHTPPEISRIPLESLCLNVSALLGNDVSLEDRLAQCITPPAPSQTHAALRTLKEVGAFNTMHQLTPLGGHLVRMPMDARVGKMLIFGAMLQCVDPILTIASALSYGRPMFVSPMDKREEADSKKRELYAPFVNAKSDHLALVAAFKQWQEARRSGGDRAGVAFCRENFLVEDVMQATLSGRKEYAGVLADLGFVSREYVHNIATGRSDDVDVIEDMYAANSRFVRAAVCAGFYPNLVRVENPPKKYVQIAGGALQVEGEAKQAKFYDKHRGRVFLHPASVNFTVSHFESGWLAVSDMVETAKVYVRQCSMIPVYAMLIFGGELTVKHEEQLISLDGWAFFKAPANVAVMIKELQGELGKQLKQKIDDPGHDLSASKAVLAVMKLLETDGF